MNLLDKCRELEKRLKSTTNRYFGDSFYDPVVILPILNIGLWYEIRDILQYFNPYSNNDHTKELCDILKIVLEYCAIEKKYNNAVFNEKLYNRSYFDNENKQPHNIADYIGRGISSDIYIRPAEIIPAYILLCERIGYDFNYILRYYDFNYIQDTNGRYNAKKV